MPKVEEKRQSLSQKIARFFDSSLYTSELSRAYKYGFFRTVF